MNTLKTAFLLTALTLFLIFLGAHFGGRDGMILAFIVAAGMNFFSYFYSDKLALSMYKAQPVTREQLQERIAALDIVLSSDQMSRLNPAGNPVIKQGWIQPS